MKSNLKCPKCYAPVEDCREFDEWGWFADEPFRCEGHLLEPVPYPELSPHCAINRTKSCGYFSEKDVQ